MNDFTKEELEIINHAIYHLDTSLYGGCKEISDLLTKTQSLINNYCEHEVLKSITDIDSVDICGDCNQIMNWLNFGWSDK